MPVAACDLRVGDTFQVNPDLTWKIERFEGKSLFYSAWSKGQLRRSTPARRSIMGFTALAQHRLPPAFDSAND